MLTIAMAVFAWNEADEIATTLASIFAQSLWRRLADLDARVQFVVVPNGCTDATAAVARRFFAEQLPSDIAADRLATEVRELEIGNKLNAWNVFVHELARPDADYHFFFDADIRLLKPDTLANMLDVLRRDPYPLVATDTIVKHLALKEHPTLLERLLLAFGKMTAAAPGQLAGSLYCTRGDFSRRLRLPRGLIVDDGFIKVMAVTNFMTEKADNLRIQPAADAAHMFEAYTKIGQIFRGQVRQAVGHTVYTWLRDWLHAGLERQPDADAGKLLAEAVAADPDFLVDMIREHSARGGWLIPRGMLGARWRRLWQQRGGRKLLYAPVALLGFCFDLPVFLAANRRLRRGELANVWGAKTTHTEAAS